MAHEPILTGPNGKVLQDGGRVERPPYECNTASARWKIKTIYANELFPKWGEAHPIYPQLRNVSYVVLEEKGGWSILDGTYKGVIGEMPKVKEIDGQTIGSAQLERLGADGSDEDVPTVLNIQYYTPTTTFEYYSKKKLTGAIFKGRMNWKDDSLQILGRRGAGRNRNDINILSGKSLAMVAAKGGSDVAVGGLKVIASNGQYNGVAEVVTGDWKSEPVAEGLWKCTERNEIQIYPYNFDRLKRIS